MKKYSYDTLALNGGLIGVERECLRVDASGRLSRSDHPESLGMSVTHPWITTDYAEALLELITPPLQDPEAVYRFLADLHVFVRQHLHEEQLWPASMPCILPHDDADIRVAEYGGSVEGRFKHLYRLGLALRYGKPMQMIAGVHFNFSPNEELLTQLAEAEGKENDRHFRNERYMGMLRRLQELGWLICYTWGSSPACDISFRPAQNVLGKVSSNSLGCPDATSMRMSKLGYENKTNLHVCLNSLDEYLHDLRRAVLTPDPRYAELGLYDAYGNLQQISANLLQIENEYYASARPKQAPHQDELPAQALQARGVAYLELRLLDINPFDPCGISLEQLRCLEVLMLYALLHPAPPFSEEHLRVAAENRYQTACCGLDQNLLLYDGDTPRRACAWAEAIFEEMLPIAEALDRQRASTQGAAAALRQALANIKNDERPARRVLEQVRRSEFIAWGLELITQHQQQLPTQLAPEVEERFQERVRQSRIDALALPQATAQSLRDYIEHYLNQMQKLNLHDA